MFFYEGKNKLTIQKNNEILCIEGWGKNSLRVRATCYTNFTDRTWALSEKVLDTENEIVVTINSNDTATIQNGRIKAEVNAAGVLSFFRDGKLFLREYYRNYFGTES